MASTESLQAAIDRVGEPVELLRNLRTRATSHGYVQPEFTNWRAEAQAWRESCALMDQSHHMNDLYINGPGALELLTGLGVNSFAGFGPGRAKQLVCTNHDGQYLGDGILFHLEDEVFDLVGGRTLADWVAFHAERAGDDVWTEVDPPSLARAGRPPLVYRYELQGPATMALMEKLLGGPVPEIKFFQMSEFEITGHRARVLRHGMAGQAGFELFGPWEEGEAVREAVQAAGAEFGLVLIGSKAYATANLESGWVPGPIPAIFSDERLRSYREWLPAARAGSLAGSLVPDDIAETYLTPHDLGYDRVIRFDHDFIGRDALETMADQAHRTKVTLVWNPEDVARVVASLWTPGPTYKFLDIPKARYGTYQTDEVVHAGDRAGISMDCGYIVNGESVVSLAVLNPEVAEPGTEVTVIWGEDPNTTKPLVEAHEQTEVRAIVAPCPFEQFARETYRVA
jgi:vanillate/3-O-methylgallate O-demethylase